MDRPDNQQMMVMPGASSALMARMPHQQPQLGGAGMTLSQMFAIARAHWRQGAMIGGAVLMAVALATMVMPKTYTATATLMVNYEINDPMGAREFPAGLLQSYMSTQLDLLGSPDVLLKVVERLKLTGHKKFIAGFKGDPRALPEFVVKNVQKKLEIRQGQFGSQLIHVTFSASDPQDASAVANEVVQVYFQRAHERLTDPATEQARRYTQELEDLKAKVTTAQQRLNEFRKSSNVVDVMAKADIEIAILNELEHRLLDAQNLRRGAESRLASDPSVSANVLGSNMVQSLKTQLSVLESKMAQLRSTLGPRHPELLEVQSQINSTRASLQSEIQRYATGTNVEVTSARELERKLQTAVDAQRKQLIEVRRLQDEGSKFQLEFDTAQAAYKKALEGYDAVMLGASGQYTNVSFVSRATPPLKPSKPKTSINLLIGVLLGGFLGVAIPFARELLSRRVRCRDDLERDHGIPVLVEFDPMPALRHTS